MLSNLQDWSSSLKMVQGAFLLTMFIYMVMFVDGGFFTAYYAWMLSIASGLIAAVISMLQRNVTMLCVDLGLVALMFIHFIQLA